MTHHDMTRRALAELLGELHTTHADVASDVTDDEMLELYLRCPTCGEQQAPPGLMDEIVRQLGLDHDPDVRASLEHYRAVMAADGEVAS